MRRSVWIYIVLLSIFLGAAIVVLVWTISAGKWGSHNGFGTFSEDFITGLQILPPSHQKITNPMYTLAREKIEKLGGTSGYLLVLDISEQKEYLFDSDGLLFSSYPVSTGSPAVPVKRIDETGQIVVETEDRSMKESIWKVREKRDKNLSAFYGPRMIYLDRYENGSWIRTDVALHGTSEPEILGSPISLGCVYHENADIIELYDKLQVGSFVVAIP